MLCEAEVVSVPHSERTNLLIIASDGLWDFLSPKVALKWLKKFILVNGSLNGAATMLRYFFFQTLFSSLSCAVLLRMLIVLL